MANLDAGNPERLHASLEADIRKLSQEVAEKKTLPQYERVPDREIVKRSLAPLVSQPAVQTPLKSGDEEGEEDFLPDYLKEADPEMKLAVERLVDQAFHEGIARAVSSAQAAGPFILDSFHDALADKLYEELKARKLI